MDTKHDNAQHLKKQSDFSISSVNKRIFLYSFSRTDFRKNKKPKRLKKNHFMQVCTRKFKGKAFYTCCVSHVVQKNHIAPKAFKTVLGM